MKLVKLLSLATVTLGMSLASANLLDRGIISGTGGFGGIGSIGIDNGIGSCGAYAANKMTAPIQTPRDLDVLMNNKSFLALEKTDQDVFLDSLTFNKQGELTSFNYEVFNNIAFSKSYEVLSLFGQQHLASSLATPLFETEKDSMLFQFSANMNLMCDGGGGHHGYRCQSRATCTKDMGSICLSTC